MIAQAWSKLVDIRRARGTAGAARFLASRLIRVRRHCVYRLPRPTDAASLAIPEPPPGFRVTVARNGNELEALGDLPDRPELGEYLEGIRQGDVVGVFVWAGNELAHHAFLMIRSPMLSILGAPDGAMLLGNAFTRPSFRGRGLQKFSIRLRTVVAWELGAKLVVSETAPDNSHSSAGLKGAGVSPAAKVALAVLGNRLILRRVSGDWPAGFVGWRG